MLFQIKTFLRQRVRIQTDFFMRFINLTNLHTQVKLHELPTCFTKQLQYKILGKTVNLGTESN